MAWLRRKKRHAALHEWTGGDTACGAVQCRGMNLEMYELVNKPAAHDRICAACQLAIATRRDKF